MCMPDAYVPRAVATALLPAPVRVPPCGLFACADCPNCGANSWVTQQSAGDVVCTSCGFVGEASLIDETAEWRSFSDKSNAVDMNRVGAPINSLLDKGGISGTSIAKGKDGRSAGFANLDRCGRGREAASTRVARRVPVRAAASERHGPDMCV